jgi:hypothetical protein
MLVTEQGHVFVSKNGKISRPINKQVFLHTKQQALIMFNSTGSSLSAFGGKNRQESDLR